MESSDRDGNTRPSYLSPEKPVRTLYGTTDWFKIEKGVQQCCLLSPCLFNLYTEHIMRNARLDELQARIIKEKHQHLRYVDDTTLLVESEEELKSLLMRVKGKSERADLRPNIKKKKKKKLRLRPWHPAPLLRGK